MLTRVEAEPLPNTRASDGLRRAEMDLEILYEARPVGLNQSLNDADEVRDRHSRWGPLQVDLRSRTRRDRLSRAHHRHH
jgi:hypothetical protein